MADIIVGEKVINKFGAKGVIISFDDKYIEVDFHTRFAKLQLDAFEKGFLRYENPDIQEKIDEKKEQEKREKELIAEKRRLILMQVNAMREKMKSEAPPGVKFSSVNVSLDPIEIRFDTSLIKHRDLIQGIFNECDKDTAVFFDHFHPVINYTLPAYIGWRGSIGRFYAGILTVYLNTYVLRVFSRTDHYSPGMYGGLTVTNSDTTEIMRVLGIEGEIYCISKNSAFAVGIRKNSTSSDYWHQSTLIYHINLDEVIRACDCKYLNDYIYEKEVNCRSYVRLFMAALCSNKAEIVFKNRAFSAVDNIVNIAAYLEEFSPKQIDFASKNQVINTLPFIKRNGFFDAEILATVEMLMKKDRGARSVYENLVLIFNQREFDISALDRRLIGFLRKFDQDDPFNPVLYGDYVEQLIAHPDVTVDSIFAKDYLERHYEMMKEKDVQCSAYENNEYSRIAQELSWIDREENGYYIIVPKTISDFKYEGQMQHNCVYTNRYYRDVIGRKSIIVFLREQKNVSFVTIEFGYRTFSVRQAYKKFNQRVDDQLYKFIVELGKQLKLEMLAME